MADLKVTIKSAIESSQAIKDLQDFASQAGKILDSIWINRGANGQFIKGHTIFKDMLVALRDIETAVNSMSNAVTSSMSSISTSATNAKNKVKEVSNEIKGVNGQTATATVKVNIQDQINGLPSRTGDLSTLSKDQIKDFVGNQMSSARMSQKVNEYVKQVEYSLKNNQSQLGLQGFIDAQLGIGARQIGGAENTRLGQKIARFGKQDQEHINRDIIANAETKRKLEADLIKQEQEVLKQQQKESDNIFSQVVASRESSDKKLAAQIDADNKMILAAEKKASLDAKKAAEDDLQIRRTIATEEKRIRDAARTEKIKSKQNIVESNVYEYNTKDIIEENIIKRKSDQLLKLNSDLRRQERESRQLIMGKNVYEYNTKDVIDQNIIGGKSKELQDMAGFYRMQQRNAAIQDALKSQKEIKQLMDELNRGPQQPKNWITENFSVDAFSSATARLLRYYASFALISGSFKVVQDLENEVYKVQEGMQGIVKYLSPLSTMAPLWANASAQAREYGVAITDVVASYETFAQQGLRAGQIVEATNAALLAANVSGISYKEAVTFITTATRVYGDEVSQAGKYIDMLASVQAKSSVNAEQMVQAFQRSGAQAKQAGISMQFLLGAYAAITEKTQQSGEVTGTGFRTITERLQRQSTINALSSVGPLSDIVFANSKGDLTNAEVILTKLAERWNLLSEAQQKYVSYTISGGRQVNTFLAMMQGFDQVLLRTKDAHESFRFSQDANEKEMQKLSKQLMILKDTTIAAMFPFVSFGNNVLNGFVTFLNKTGIAAYGLATAVTYLSVTAIPNLLSILSTTSPLLQTFGLALSGVFAMMGTSLGVVTGVVTALASLSGGWYLYNNYISESAQKTKALTEELSKVADKITEVQKRGQSAAASDIFSDFLKNASVQEKQAMIDVGASYVKTEHGISIENTSSNMQKFMSKYGNVGGAAMSDEMNAFLKTEGGKRFFAEVSRIGRMTTEERSNASSFNPGFMGYFMSPLYSTFGGNKTARSAEDLNLQFGSNMSPEFWTKVYKALDDSALGFYESLKSNIKDNSPQAKTTAGKITKDLDAMAEGYLELAAAQADQKSHSWKRRTFTNYESNMEQYREMISIQDSLRTDSANANISLIKAKLSGDVESIGKAQKEVDKLKDALIAADKAVDSLTYKVANEQGRAMIKWAQEADEKVAGLWKQINNIISNAGRTWDFKFNFIASLTDMLPGWFKTLTGGMATIGGGKFFSDWTKSNLQEGYVKEAKEMIDIRAKSAKQAEGVKQDEEERYKKLSKSEKQAQMAYHNEIIQSANIAIDAYKTSNKDIDAKIIDPVQRAIIARHANIKNAEIDLYSQTLREIDRKSGGGAGQAAKTDAQERIRLLEAEQEVTRELRNEWLKFGEQDKFSTKWNAKIQELLDKASELRDVVKKINDLPEEDKHKKLAEANVLEKQAQLMKDRQNEAVKIDAAQQRQRVFFKDEEQRMRDKLSLQQDYSKLMFESKYAPSLIEQGEYEKQQLQEQILLETQVLELKKQQALERYSLSGLYSKEKALQLSLEDETVKAQQRVVDKEKERLGLIDAQTEAKIRQKAFQSVAEIQGIIGGALFDTISLKGREQKDQQIRDAKKALDQARAEATTAGYGVSEAESTGSIDKINAAREKWNQVNKQLQDAQDKMNDINKSTNKWKEVLQNIGDVIIKKITDKLAEMLVKNSGLDNILGGLFGGIEGGGGLFGKISSGGGSNALAGLLSGGAAMGGGLFSTLPSYAQAGLSAGGSFLNYMSNGSLGNIWEGLSGGGRSASQSGNMGFLGNGGIGMYLSSALMGYAIGSKQKSKGAGFLTGALGGFLSGGVPGAIIGGLAGLFGSGGDEEPPAPTPAREFYPLFKNTQALDANTSALMKLSENVFNAPSTFAFNKLQAENNAPRMVNITINAGAASAKDIATEVNRAVSRAYTQSSTQISGVSSNWG